MVSNARDDLPEPLTPVTTVISLWGTSTLTLFRLCVRAPRTRRDSESERAADGLAEMSSLVAKGVSSDSGVGAHCLNLKLYGVKKFGANRVGRLVRRFRQPSHRIRELCSSAWSLILHDSVRQI